MRETRNTARDHFIGGPHLLCLSSFWLNGLRLSYFWVVRLKSGREDVGRMGSDSHVGPPTDTQSTSTRISQAPTHADLRKDSRYTIEFVSGSHLTLWSRDQVRVR